MRTKLITYLEAGGAVYFEGNDIGYSNEGYNIWAYTGLNYAGDGSSSTTGNVQNITGSEICIGMEFNYPWRSEADNYVDYFTVNGGTIIFNSQDDKSRAGCYTGPFNNYRTITSSVFFSVFEENGTTRQELMSTYMDFLTEETGISENNNTVISTSVSNPSTNFINMILSLNTTSFCELSLFDITGRKISTIYSGILSSGIHSLNISTFEMTSGTYFVFGTLGNQNIYLKTVLIK